MLLRTWTRLFRPHAPERPPEAGFVPALTAASVSAAPLPATAATALGAVGAALERLSPRAAEDFAARASALVGRLGEEVFAEVCRLLTVASATRHTARLADIIQETCRAAEALAGDERSTALLGAAASLYAEQPLLGAAALRVAAQHPELTVEAFAAWLAAGRALCGSDAVKLGPYVRLETAQARNILESCLPGLPLSEVAPTLQHYLRALTGRAFRLATPTSDAVGGDVGGRVTPTGDAPTLILPRRVAVFAERDRNFLLYKLLAAQGAGRLLFDTHTPDTPPLIAAYEATRAFFSDLGAGAGGLSHVDFAVVRDRAAERVLPPRPASVTVGDALALFPDMESAEALFDVIEMARIVRRLRSRYRGVERDLAALAEPLLASRRSLAGASLTAAAVELLFRLALVGRVGADIQAEYAALTETLAAALAPCLTEGATVADSLRVTLDIYRLLPPPTQRRWSPEIAAPPLRERPSAPVVGAVSVGAAGEAQTPTRAATDVSIEGDQAAAADDAADDLEQDTPAARTPDVSATVGEPLGRWVVVGAHQYPEWDVRLGDYRPDWCRVLDLSVADESAAALGMADDATAARLRRAFERWRPAELNWVRPTTDGQEVVVDALIERRIERRRRSWASDAVYAVRRHVTRSVAALLLLDVSRSTGERLDERPDARQGECADAGLAADAARRVLDGEIESARCLAAALEQLGDRFAVYAFNSRGRGAVHCFRLKAFGESAGRLSRRLAALTPAANTRLGAAVRHATRLLAAESARQRLLLVVTDGLPQDGDYGDVTYAVADTAQALAEAQAVGVRPLGIILEAGQSEGLLEVLFGRGRYARLRAASHLPEALPRLYRRWTF
ncbi:MAG: hypothetical protein NZ585_14295 [Chloracidobacterium sp.]|nr:hypothetical protein [Chloracidobacterium sp.]MDW8217888.1 hypothetical protein [Acidobacteriota bacterium]